MSRFANLMSISSQKFPINVIMRDDFNRIDGNITTTENNFPVSGSWKWDTANNGRISGKYFYPSATVSSWSSISKYKTFTSNRIKISIKGYQSGGTPNLKIYMGVSTIGTPSGTSNGLQVNFNVSSTNFQVYAYQYNGTTLAQNTGNFNSTIPITTTVDIDATLIDNNLVVLLNGTQIMNYTFPTSFILQGDKNGIGFYYISGQNPYLKEVIISEV